MANIRHTVVVRKDLELPPGLLAAQVAHISDQFMRLGVLHNKKNIKFNEIQLEWMESPYLSVLAVNTRDELEIIRKRAEDAGLRVYVWTDTIPCPTLKGEVFLTDVGISIGPDDFDKIKLITGNLPLY